MIFHLKVYTTKQALDSHILQAHKDPLLICPMCQKPLPSAISLKKHLANCHDMKKIDPTHHPYDCTTCHRSYKSQSGLAFHNKSSHQVSSQLKSIKSCIEYHESQNHELQFMNFLFFPGY